MCSYTYSLMKFGSVMVMWGPERCVRILLAPDCMRAAGELEIRIHGFDRDLPIEIAPLIALSLLAPSLAIKINTWAVFITPLAALVQALVDARRSQKWQIYFHDHVTCIRLRTWGLEIHVLKQAEEEWMPWLAAGKAALSPTRLSDPEQYARFEATTAWRERVGLGPDLDMWKTNVFVATVV